MRVAAAFFPSHWGDWDEEIALFMGNGRDNARAANCPGSHWSVASQEGPPRGNSQAHRGHGLANGLEFHYSRVQLCGFHYVRAIPSGVHYAGG